MAPFSRNDVKHLRTVFSDVQYGATEAGSTDMTAGDIRSIHSVENDYWRIKLGNEDQNLSFLVSDTYPLAGA